jgi:hypothetical protein
MIACFALWVERRRLDVAKIDEATVGAFLVHLCERRPESATIWAV